MPLVLEQFPVGLIPGAEYHACVAECGQRDLFILLTDGIVEVTGRAGSGVRLGTGGAPIDREASRPLAGIAI